MNSLLSSHVTDLLSSTPSSLRTIVYIASGLKRRWIRSCHPLLKALLCSLYFVVDCLWAPSLRGPASSDHCLTNLLAVHSSAYSQHTSHADFVEFLVTGSLPPPRLLFYFLKQREVFCFFVFTYLFLAVLGLCFCSWALSSCGEWGLPFTVVASLVMELGL